MLSDHCLLCPHTAGQCGRGTASGPLCKWGKGALKGDIICLKPHRGPRTQVLWLLDPSFFSAPTYFLKSFRRPAHLVKCYPRPSIAMERQKPQFLHSWIWRTKCITREIDIKISFCRKVKDRLSKKFPALWNVTRRRKSNTRKLWWPFGPNPGTWRFTVTKYMEILY